MVITAKRGLFLWLLAVTLAASLPATCAVSRAHPAQPEPPEPCRDSAEIRSSSESRYECAPGARLEIYPAEKDYRGNPAALFKCVCGPSVPDAGGAK